MHIIGKVSSINTSDNVLNLGVYDKDKNGINLKIEANAAVGIAIGLVYDFEYKVFEGERVSYWVTSFEAVESFETLKKDEVLRNFYPSSPISIEEAKGELESYINKIDNKIVREITINLINKYEDKIFV